MLLRPGDAHHTDYQAAFNLRTALKPQLRALCKTSKAAGVMVDWCRSNGLPFAVRCGGHSYEGFSQSTSVVIDMRLMNAISAIRSGPGNFYSAHAQAYCSLVERGVMSGQGQTAKWRAS